MNPDYKILFRFSHWFLARNCDDFIKHKYFLAKEVELGTYTVIRWF